MDMIGDYTIWLNDSPLWSTSDPELADLYYEEIVGEHAAGEVWLTSPARPAA